LRTLRPAERATRSIEVPIIRDRARSRIAPRRLSDSAAPHVSAVVASAILSLEIRAFMTVQPISLHRKDKLEAGGHQGQTKVLRQLRVPATIGEKTPKDRGDLSALHAQNTKC
jgi:hypothetical protein